MKKRIFFAVFFALLLPLSSYGYMVDIVFHDSIVMGYEFAGSIHDSSGYGDLYPAAGALSAKLLSPSGDSWIQTTNHLSVWQQSASNQTQIHFLWSFETGYHIEPGGYASLMGPTGLWDGVLKIIPEYGNGTLPVQWSVSKTHSGNVGDYPSPHGVLALDSHHYPGYEEPYTDFLTISFWAGIPMLDTTVLGTNNAWFTGSEEFIITLTEPTPMPEPSTILLFASGIALLALLARKRFSIDQLPVKCFWNR